MNNVELENIHSYKYMGFMSMPSDEIKSGLYDLGEPLRSQMGRL